VALRGSRETGVDQEMTTPGATLAALRELVPRTCGHCGKAFTAIKKARYCCHSCRSMAYRKRKNENRQTQPRN
jgi:hypothetical protein